MTAQEKLIGQTIIHRNDTVRDLTFASPVVQIGIQGPVGSKFYFNGNDGDVIELSSYGIYSLDLTGTSASISALHFDYIPFIGDNAHRVIIDYIMEPKKAVEEDSI